MFVSWTRNERGFVALATTAVMASILFLISGTNFYKSFFEMRQVNREIACIRSLAAAEAGIQNALAQIGLNAYTGFINTSPIHVANFRSVTGQIAGSYSVVIDYPNQADWIVIYSEATVDGDRRLLEGRVFLDSNLSKFLVYADTPEFTSGTDAQYGVHDGISPEGVPANKNDRAALYFTGRWRLVGSNISLYGDVNVESVIEDASTNSRIRGDSYVFSFAQDANGNVTHRGIIGPLMVGDGFDDDLDRNQDGFINASDYMDHHDLTETGGGDSHPMEDIVSIDHNFYQANNNIPGFAGDKPKNRFLRLEAINGGTATRVVEYTNAAFSTPVATYDLPSHAVVYVKGGVYLKGEIGGRVSIVSSDDIFFDGNVSYSGGQTTANSNHSAAFLAKDKLFFRANDLAVSGILYAENSSGTSPAYDARYNTNGQYDPNSKKKLRLYGNRIIKGTTNLSHYPDRIYAYDSQLKYFRPPGLPVSPRLETVRETNFPGGGGGLTP